METLQETLEKVIDFIVFLFSLSFLFKETKFEQFLMSSGRRFQDGAAPCIVI